MNQDGLQAVLAGWTDETFLELLSVTHPSIAQPIRLVNDYQELVSNSETYSPFPFQAQTHVRSEERTAEATLTCDAVDLRLVRALRGLVGRPSVQYSVVMASAPDEIQQGPIDYSILGFSTAGSTLTLRGSFGMDLLGQKFPMDAFGPSNAIAA